MRCTILILMFLLCFSIVYADEFEVMDYYARAGTTSCYVNGQALIPFAQFRGNVPLPGFIKAIAIETEPDKYRKVTGNFYTTEYEPVTVSGIGETVLFISDEYQFNEKQEYKVVMSGVHYEIIPLYEDVSLLQFQFNCPGYKHSCRHVNIEIDNCTVDRYYITVDFHGLGLMNFSQVNVTRDVIFTLSTEQYPSEIDQISVPLTRQFFQTGNDSFMMRIPVEDVKAEIQSVSAEVTGCISELYRLTDRVRCVKIKPINRTPIAEENVLYECRPIQVDDGVVENICTQVLILPPEEPPEEPKLTVEIMDLLRRIVHLVTNTKFI